MIMKIQKSITAILSLLMSFNTVIICYAEETNDDTTKSILFQMKNMKTLVIHNQYMKLMRM